MPLEVIMKGAWISTAFALILALPALLTFFSIYYATGNLILGIVVGFSLHFTILAYSERIASLLLRLFD